MTRSFFTIAMCTSLLCSVASADLRYELIDIPLPSGVTSMYVSGMAQTSTAFCAGGGYKTWMWNGSWTTVGETYSVGSAQCVSTTGYMGGAKSSTAKGWFVSGGSSTVRDLPIATNAYGSRKAYGVNDYGLFTGATDADIPGWGPGRTAWVYDWQTKGVTYLPAYNLAGDTSMLATLMLGMAVNNAGVVVGVAREADYWWDGFVWTASGGVESLDLVTTGSGSVGLYDISSNGYIAGHRNNTIFIKKLGEAGYVSTGLSGYYLTPCGVNDTGMLATGSSVYHNGVAESIQSLLVDTGGYTGFQLIDIDNRGWIIAEVWNGAYNNPHSVVLLTPVRGDNVISNSSFDSDAGLTIGGEGTATIVVDPGDGANSCLQMTTGSPVYVEQIVDTPNGTFEIAFDYQVLDTGCTLEVSLNGQTLQTLGPLDGTDDWVNYGFLVADPSLFDLDDAALRITLYHGESGMRILMDGLEMRDIPEPTTMCLLAMGGLALMRRRRKA